ncbi:MAG: hypothetical protein EBS47_03945 [Betaproteobacteria bacterium]|jgi:hypothetical protein|nr:hypothetical protein [Betaproteobacteria bacterium]NBT10001.1 hypothetical protein [Betaproteobacteria bacterium]NBU49250.1 hypothetical protein [Betaproteobacteria bacterium]NBX95449.1 hypothetical protein [Betaproteobacteria bacterium]
MNPISSGNGPLNQPLGVTTPRTEGGHAHEQVAGTQGSIAKGSLERQTEQMQYTPRLNSPDANPNEGLPPPKSPVVSGQGLHAALTQFESQEIQMGLSEVTRLLHMAQRENRKAQRQDMSTALEESVKALESQVGHMKEAAQKRHTAAVVSCCINIASGMAQGAMAGKSLGANANAQAYNSIGEASARVLSAGGSMAQAQGEYSASQDDQAVKLTEGRLNRLEKQYQEAHSMLGESKETLQAVMETLKALQQTQNIKDISRNL